MTSWLGLRYRGEPLAGATKCACRSRHAVVAGIGAIGAAAMTFRSFPIRLSGFLSLVIALLFAAIASAQDRPVLEFTRGADLLIREAQYTAAEYTLKHGWGHSTFDAAICDAIDAGVPSVALYHHEPQHDDRFLERELDDLRLRYGSSGLHIFLAREGECVELG